MLEYEAKKNSGLAELIENISYLSLEQIKSHPLRMLPWIRQELISMKEIALNKQKEINSYAAIAHLVKNGILSDPMGVTKSWIGSSEFIKLSRGNLQMNYGDLVWFDQKGGVWIDSIYCNPYDPAINAQTKIVSKMSKMEYMDAVRNKTNNNSIGNVNSITSPIAGVRISRV